MKADYYVYAYLDPRNLEVFYYGKGKGSRMYAHLFDRADTKKVKRIAQIKRAGYEPWIRIIAKDLTDKEAKLAEAAFLWRSGKSITNISGGHFSKKFRPINSLNRAMPGFDYRKGVYYYNVGEGETRNWEDYRRYSFVSAGGKPDRRKPKPIWRDAMLEFNPGDIILAYITGYGFVGVGRITKRAVMVRDVRIGRKKLLSLVTATGMGHHLNNLKWADYVARVKWIKTIPREQAKFRSNVGLYTPQAVRASLEWQPRTIRFVEKSFGVDIAKLAD